LRRSNSSGLVTRGSGTDRLPTWIVGMGVGVAVGVAVGVLVGVAVLVGLAVSVGNGVALGAGVDVGADAGAQADNIRLTSKNTTNVRFILRVLLWRSAAQRHAVQPHAERAKRAERCRLDAQVGQFCKIRTFELLLPYKSQNK